MKREFVAPVSMQVNSANQLETIKEGLHKLGYDVKYNVFRPECFIVNNWDAWIGYAGIVHFEDRLNASRCLIDHFNPDLFLGLAAISKGPELHPNEYVRIGNNSKLLQVIRKEKNGQYILTDGDEKGGTYFISPEYLHRASKEELIKHFTADSEPTSSEEGFNPDIGVNESGDFVNNEHNVSVNDRSGIITHGVIKLADVQELIPRRSHEESRIRQVMQAIQRRLSTSQNIPESWADELNSLLYDRIERSAEA